jgi:hypothetical protein
MGQLQDDTHPPNKTLVEETILPPSILPIPTSTPRAARGDGWDRVRQGGAAGWDLAIGNSPPGSTESRPTGDWGSVKEGPPGRNQREKGLATGFGPGAK